MFNFVAEIGCNHLGSMDLAKEHIDVFSSFSQAKIMKFQKRTLMNLMTPEEYQAPHPHPEFAHGQTYGEHRENLEFNMQQHQELFNYCQNKNLQYACSAWDLQAAMDLVRYLPGLAYIKIPSASNLNFKMMSYILENSFCDLHVSLGMTTRQEIDQILDFLAQKNSEKRAVVYACTSGYPLAFEDVYLLEITRLKEMCASQFLGIGFSNHALGIAMDIAAATLGATWIERHVVTCRSTIRHTDAAASLEPDGVRKLIRDLSALEKALKFKNSDHLPEVEKVQRQKLKRVK